MRGFPILSSLCCKVRHSWKSSRKLDARERFAIRRAAGDKFPACTHLAPRDEPPSRGARGLLSSAARLSPRPGIPCPSATQENSAEALIFGRGQPPLAWWRSGGLASVLVTSHYVYWSCAA